MANQSNFVRTLIDVTGSSHFKTNFQCSETEDCDRYCRHLAFFFSLEFDFRKQTRFNQPHVDARGGRRFYQNIVRQMKDQIQQNYALGFSQVQLLMLGRLNSYMYIISHKHS